MKITSIRRQADEATDSAMRPLLLEGLQTDLLRLEGRMSTRLEHAFHDLEASTDTRLRHAAMARRLAYATAMLDITVAPNPELNLFDTISFLEISRSALNRYWIPEVFGAKGKEITVAFEASLAEAWKIAHTVISAKQRGELSSIISAWIESHPDTRIVDTLRFSRFPDLTSAEVPSSDARWFRSLIQHANRALTTADETRLLAERAFYYVQRAPFLMRLQARVASHELILEGYRSIREPILLLVAGLCLFFPLRAAFARLAPPLLLKHSEKPL
jgi:hypothetical protein